MFIKLDCNFQMKNRIHNIQSIGSSSLMCTRRFFYNSLVLLSVFLGVSVSCSSVLAEIPVKKSEINREYLRIIESERAGINRRHATEELVSGILALGIGSYGTYSDQPNIIVRGGYSAIQSGGVLVLGDALGKLYRPNLTLKLDHAFRDSQEMSYQRFKLLTSEFQRAKDHAEHIQYLYSFGILAVVHGVDGYREAEQSKTLSGIHYFFAFNFSVGTIYHLARLLQEEDGGEDSSQMLQVRPKRRKLRFGLNGALQPAVSYQF